MVDMETSATLPATTDPTASRQMFELERALAQLPLELTKTICRYHRISIRYCLGGLFVLAMLAACYVAAEIVLPIVLAPLG